MRMFHHLFASTSDEELSGDAPETRPRGHSRGRKEHCGSPCCTQPETPACQDAKPLTDFRGGDKLVVERIHRGRLACRLYAMGLTPGTPLTIESPGPGAVRFIVRGSSIALGRAQAEKILCVPAGKAAQHGSNTSEASHGADHEQESPHSSRDTSAHAHPFLRLKGFIT
jgi:Fe2+ transport system protein FeoA